MKINYDLSSGWIISALAEKISSRITKEHEETLSEVVLHLPYRSYWGNWSDEKDVLWVTHVDKVWKYVQLIFSFFYCSHVIFISEETYTRFLWLDKLLGKKSSVVMPSSNRSTGVNRRLHFGVFTKVYEDGRKNESWIRDFILEFNKESILVSIIGDGWDSVVQELRDFDYDIEHRIEFNGIEYETILNSCDFVLYSGWDEGAISVLDAACFGKQILATYQGFHRDLEYDPLTMVKSRKEFVNCGTELNRYIMGVRTQISLLQNHDFALEILKQLECKSKLMRESRVPSKLNQWIMTKCITICDRIF